jgi:hypothetical protein
MKTNEEDFINLVRKMRDAQKDYFKDRKPSHLQNARDLERRVDKAIASLQTAQLNAVSPAMF